MGENRVSKNVQKGVVGTIVTGVSIFLADQLEKRLSIPSEASAVVIAGVTYAMINFIRHFKFGKR